MMNMGLTRLTARPPARFRPLPRRRHRPPQRRPSGRHRAPRQLGERGFRRRLRGGDVRSPPERQPELRAPPRRGQGPWWNGPAEGRYACCSAVRTVASLTRRWTCVTRSLRSQRRRTTGVSTSLTPACSCPTSSSWQPVAAGAELPRGRRATDPATREELESMYCALEDGLARIRFFKGTRRPAVGSADPANRARAGGVGRARGAAHAGDRIRDRPLPGPHR